MSRRRHKGNSKQTGAFHCWTTSHRPENVTVRDGIETSSRLDVSSLGEERHTGTEGGLTVGDAVHPLLCGSDTA